MSFPVALQLYSVRDAMAEDFAGTIKKVKDMGYDGVEFAGLFDHSAEEVKKICAEVGVEPIPKRQLQLMPRSAVSISQFRMPLRKDVPAQSFLTILLRESSALPL